MTDDEMDVDSTRSADSIPSASEVTEACSRAYWAQREATLEMIDGGRTETVVDAMIEDLLARAQVGIDQSPGKAGWHCRSGCAFCCYSRVEIHPLEALAVARYLQRTKSPDQLAAIVQRLRERVRVMRPMTVDQWKHTTIACALLNEDQTCGVYAVRPLACRCYHSLSVEKCEEAFHYPTAPNTTPIDYFAKVWVVAVGNGMMDAQREKGVDSQGYELNSAVLCALTTPDAATKWINGQNVFENCLIDKNNQRVPPPAVAPIRPVAVSRNAPCPCGSGKKFKKCCMVKDSG
jgi:Fe-S-cluster containining protein